MTGPEAEEFRQWLRQGLERAAPLAMTSRLVDDSRRDNDSLWAALAELGILDFGSAAGEDLDATMLPILFEETGRVLLPAGHLTNLSVAATLLEGTSTASSVGPFDTGARYAFADRPAQGVADVSVEHEGDLWLLSGAKARVIDAEVATAMLVSVSEGDAESVFLVDPRAAGVTIDERPSLDPTRSALTVTFSRTKAEPIGARGQASQPLRRARLRLSAAIASESAGAAARCLETTVEHVKTRHQFGQAIGGFQAVKHQCADMFMAVQASTAASAAAWQSLEDDHAIAEPRVRAAALTATTALAQCVRITEQLHGGIAFTWEHEAHRYHKRSKSTELIQGGVDELARSVAAAVLDSGVSVLDSLVVTR